MYLNFFAGTAAEMIKLYPVIQVAREKGHSVRVIASGQSRENFLMQYRDLGLPLDKLVFLNESEGDLSHARSALRWFLRAVLLPPKRFTAKLLSGEKGFLVIHGDTLSTLAGAWLGRRAKQIVVHVEAGLRSPSLFNPFPEEIIRRLVSRLAHVHMAPDQSAALRLAPGDVVNTQGNTLMDALLLIAETALPPDTGEPFALVNVHRFENLNSRRRWRAILSAVARAGEKMKVVFVAHPQTKRKIEHDREFKQLVSAHSIEVRDRLPFSEFIQLLKHSQFVISDGGSNQEECSYLGKPCLLMRRHTERREGLYGNCVLSQFDPAIIDAFFNKPEYFFAISNPPAFRPSIAIVEALEQRCDSPA